MRSRFLRSNRRTFIRVAGASALTLPFARSRAAAQAGAFPVRLVIVSRPNGYVPASRANNSDTSRHSPLFDPSGSERDFTLGPMLSALDPFKQDMVFVKGLDLDATRQIPRGEHPDGADALLTGRRRGGPSVDQLIADTLDATPYKHIALSVGFHGSDMQPHKNSNGNMIGLDGDPFSVFDDLFSDFTPTSSSGPDVRARQGSVLDFVRSQIRTLQGELCGEERVKFEAHLEAIRSIETQLDGSSVGCAVPGRPQGFDYRNVNEREKVYDSQIDLAVTALSCQLTPVLPFIWGGGGGNDEDPQSWIRDGRGNRFERSHHHYSHSMHGTNQDQYREISEWYIRKFAEFLGKLKAIPEGDGTLLDNCIVVFTTDQRHGWSHSHIDMPFIIFGRAGGQLETGRYLNYGGRPHNALLVSLARLMGVDIEEFGDSDFHDGPLPGFADV